MMSSSNLKTTNVLVPVADGSEEIETSTIVDTLVRGGATVTVASVSSNKNMIVTCSRGLKLCADKFISDCKGHEWDMIVLPGGLPGANHLRDSVDLKELLKHQKASGRFIAAICAAPAVVLQTHGLLDGKTATCYPAPKFTDTLVLKSNDRVCVDGNFITSQGPATSLEFSLQLVEVLFGKKKAADVGAEMLFIH